ncbi:hypothetical protein ACLOJK_024318 [Asimina triloba]
MEEAMLLSIGRMGSSVLRAGVDGGRRWCSSGVSGRRCWLGRKGWPARDEWAAIVGGDDRPGETRTGGGCHDRICRRWRWIFRERRLPSDLL